MFVVRRVYSSRERERDGFVWDASKEGRTNRFTGYGSGT